MSFIRSGSSPEHLYVYESVSDKCVHIDTPELCFAVPRKAFYKLCRLFRRNYETADDRIEADGLALQERWVNNKTGRLHRSEPSVGHIMRGDWSCKHVLFWKRKFMPLWKVTWFYVYNNVMEDIGKA